MPPPQFDDRRIYLICGVRNTLPRLRDFHSHDSNHHGVGQIPNLPDAMNAKADFIKDPSPRKPIFSETRLEYIFQKAVTHLVRARSTAERWLGDTGWDGY